MKLVILFVCCLSFLNVFGQSDDTPNIALIATDVKGFIPDGWGMLMEGKGDLNEDGSKDLVFVIQKIGTELDAVYYHELPRILIIAFQQPPSRNYAVQLIKEDFILLASEGGVYGDPLESLEIHDNGVLHIYYYGGSAVRWAEEYKFRYEDLGFRLIGVELSGYHNIHGKTDEWSYNLLSGKAKKKMYNKFNDSITTEKWFRIKPNTGKLFLKDLPPNHNWEFFRQEKFIPID